MPTFLIINGYAGSGKSTVAQTFAKNNNFALISQDEFLFGLNASNGKRELTSEDHTVAIKNMHDCALNYMHLNRDIIIEGALVSISDKDPLDIRDFIKLAERMGYKVIVVTFTANKKVCFSRQKKRHYIVPKDVDLKLHQALTDIDQKINGEIVIDTSNYSVDTLVQKLQQLI